MVRVQDPDDRKETGVQRNLWVLGLLTFLGAQMALTCQVYAQTTFPDPYRAAPAFDPTAPWCLAERASVDRRMVPDGTVLKIGDHHFRVCRGDLGEEVIKRKIMSINPARVEGLSSRFSVVGLFLNLQSWEKVQASLLRNKPRTNSVTVGNLHYEVYSSEPNRTPAGKIKSVQNYTYWGTEVPRHVAHCSNTHTGDQIQRTRCFLYAEYLGAYTGRLHFIGSDTNPDFPVIPFERFPEFASDIVKIFDASRAAATEAPNAD